MKTADYYMSLPYKVEIIPDTVEGGYVAMYPELPGCITYADTMEEALRQLKEAQYQWLVAAIEDKIVIHEPSGEGKTYSGQFKLRLPKSLHKELALQAEQEGISMNQYCVYLLSARHIHSAR